ncbi:ABC transporter ATP-binding protein [Bosea sp. (in: a-proteobacteria)]|uniref:ABC transporter ATP-binding protein n=1 Tax=Bosea sp. (in: a-proteobacteria) TaxID=1871050 RepID=UPI00260C0E8A|nr:ATP-binding cassette domain-containing protein [Bosea sp. (in: a-proteobacteria)]MCO5089509.1 ATP-binding cassette domain-containing protein [Bosea sp. (in: a-proteobacteria)]
MAAAAPPSRDRAGAKECILRVENLSVRFPQQGTGGVKAVQDVSFDLGADEILGIVGESGSGKTTLGRCVAGLIQPSEGMIHVEAPGSGARSPATADKIQMVFQESTTALNPRLAVWRSVAEAVSGGQSVSSRLQPAAMAQLQRVGLSPEQGLKLPRELSGGQRQRVGIARALASGARIIVCDEAVAALDVSVRARVLNLIADLRRSAGVSFIFISHDMSVVAHLADRVLVMQHGRIVEQGTTRDIIANPSHDYTKHLISCVPDIALC